MEKRRELVKNEGNSVGEGGLEKENFKRRLCAQLLLYGAERRKARAVKYKEEEEGERLRRGKDVSDISAGEKKKGGKPRLFCGETAKERDDPLPADSEGRENRGDEPPEDSEEAFRRAFGGAKARSEKAKNPDGDVRRQNDGSRLENEALAFVGGALYDAPKGRHPAGRNFEHEAGAFILLI